MVGQWLKLEIPARSMIEGNPSMYGLCIPLHILVFEFTKNGLLTKFGYHNCGPLMKDHLL